MNCTWTDDLSVGVLEIDNQHKELFRRNDAFLKAISEGRGREELVMLVTFLEVYIINHFSLEELYMQKYAYPDYEGHVALHRGFVATVLDLRRQVNAGGGEELAGRAKVLIVDWLTHHIMVVDRKLGAFLKTKLSPERQDAYLLGSQETERRYRGGPQDGLLLMIEDGVLEAGEHRVALSSGRQTARLTVPAGRRCRIALSGSEGSFVVLADDGTVLDGREDAPIELPAGTFRIIAGADRQQFTIDVAGA